MNRSGKMAEQDWASLGFEAQGDFRQSTMEFHISRSARARYRVPDLLFSFSGNVVFADVASSRELAHRMNAVREKSASPERVVHPGALFAMGLIDEATHALFAHYREEIDPQVIADALVWFEARVGVRGLERLLLAFVEKFPGVSVYQGKETAKQWLAGSTEGYPHRHVAFEEMILLWLANKNPAFTPFKELFDEAQLLPTKTYTAVTAHLREYFATRPSVDDEYPNIIDLMLAPTLASPESLSGQLALLQRKWGPKIANVMRRLVLAGDVLKEEELAIWMQFHPPSQHAEEAGRRWGAKPLHESQRGQVPDFAVQQHEYERFSPDQEWMPSTVLIAKSTYVWLDQLSKRYHCQIHRLDQIPDEELGALASRGFNALWLIGVWERSRASQTIKRLCGNAEAVASAYSLYDYSIAADLGAEEAYRNLRDRAAAKGIRLASDMVPNHMGIDSRWVIDHPEWFLSRGDSPYPAYRFDGPDLSNDDRIEIKIEDHYYEQSDAAVVFRRRDKWTGDTQYVYHGNDGTSFPWNDTAQLNYLSAQVREQVIQTILQVARSFPIIRFDAAMTLAKRHIQRLWFPAPGAGGSIPSRAESSMTTAEFDAAIPQEFWREVVDRVAAEVPGTLLLAEAFWLMEGYFVRTLGMHRVYNSAFMVMLRDEDNANYRSVLKNTLEFDPGIMKRYVNFMSNPDERTAIDQFGNGDKFFGVASMMATLPGLPMFGHGQVEGFTEKYGMEYYRPRFDEVPDQSLIARHQREIAPLLHRRKLFAESDHFLLYDYWRPDGGVDENVFAYSNRSGDQRALVLFNNSYSSTRGTIHHSTNFADKATGSMRQRELRDGLALAADGDIFLGFRNMSNGLEYIRRASDVAQHGFSMELRGYQYAVLLDWRELRSDADHPWAELHAILRGDGVPSLEEAFVDLKMKPVHDAIYALLEPSLVEALAAEAALAIVPAADPKAKAAKKGTAALLANSETATAATEGNTTGAATATKVALISELKARALHLLEVSRTALGWTEPPFDGTLRTAVRGPAAAKLAEEKLDGLLKSLVQLPALEAAFPKPLPEPANQVLPGKAASVKVWAPLLAATVLRWALPLASVGSVPPGKSSRSVDTFEKLYLRKPLAHAFKRLEIEGEESWRQASRVLLLVEDAPSRQPVFDMLLHLLEQSAEVRWLAGVHDAGEKTYFIKEPFEQLLWWLQVPRLVATAAAPVIPTSLAKTLEKTLDEISAQAKKGSAAALAAGYDYKMLLQNAMPKQPSASARQPVKPSAKQPPRPKTAVKGKAKASSKKLGSALTPSTTAKAEARGKTPEEKSSVAAKKVSAKKQAAKKIATRPGAALETVPIAPAPARTMPGMVLGGTVPPGTKKPKK